MATGLQLWIMQDQGFAGLASGVLLGGYEATRFKAKATVSPLATVYVHTSASKADEQFEAGLAFGKGTLLAR